VNISIHKGDRRKYTILTMEFHHSGPLEKCIPNTVRKTRLAKKLQNYWTKIRRYSKLFSAWLHHYSSKFHPPANYQKSWNYGNDVVGLFCWPRKSIWQASSKNALENVAGVRCLYGSHLLLAFKSLHSCSEVKFNSHRGCLSDFDKRVCCRQSFA